MRLKPWQIPLILALLCSCYGRSAAVPVEAASAEVPSGTLAAFDSWTSALEADLGTEAPLAFPFDAPRPADLTQQELKIVLSLRRLILNGETDELNSLADRVVRNQEEKPVQLHFWLAFAQNRLHLDQACLGSLTALLDRPEGGRDLEKGQRIWVLTATADQMFLAGDRKLAASLYGRLAFSSVEQLNLWGNYQLAGLEFLEREFGEAGRRYGLVCESGGSGTWREHACAMAKIAENLDNLSKEGEPHGAVAIAAP